jgi:OFA family oxalate/formate antiporter-like MFS transporter
MTAYSFKTMLIVMGIAFTIVVTGLAQLLKPPHLVLQFIKEYGDVGRKKREGLGKVPVVIKEDFTPKEMLGTVQFYMLWFMYACGAGAGLMIISVTKKIVAAEVTAEAMATAAVVGLAVGNGAGRVIAGILSDKIGRKVTMFSFFVFQAILLILLSKAQGDSPLASAPALIVISALIGANYGSNLALFPSITKDFFGLKNFGTNYGLIFTSWGVGGFLLAKLAGAMYVKYQTFNIAYYGAAGLLVLASVMVFFLKPPHHTDSAVENNDDQPATALNAASR